MIVPSMNTQTIPPLLVITKTVDFVAQPKAKRLFTIHRDSSGLLFACWLIIFSLETYYRNATKPDEAIYVGGAWSLLGLFVIFRRIYLLKELGNRWKKIGNEIDKQTIRVQPEGLELEHSIGTQQFGTRHFFPWSTFDQFKVTQNSLCFSNEWQSTIWISMEYFSEDEIGAIKSLVNSQVKKRERLPTFRKVFSR
jgi:hypothetical protein